MFKLPNKENNENFNLIRTGTRKLTTSKKRDVDNVNYSKHKKKSIKNNK